MTVEKEIQNLYGNNIGINTVKAILKTIQQLLQESGLFLQALELLLWL